MNISQIQTAPQNTEDETMSVLSHATELLTLSQQFISTAKQALHTQEYTQSITPSPSPAPRTIPSEHPAFVNFLVLINATPA
jgi:hypothetical protein